MSRSPRQRLADLLLGTGTKTRLRVGQAGLGLLLAAFSIAVMQYLGAVVGAPPRLLLSWSVLSFGGLISFYLAIRSGWSKRFADPSLTVVQMGYGIVCCAAGYAFIGALRGAAFPILMVILMFGMFNLKTRVALGISLFAIAMFGLVMVAMSRLQPELYRPEVELGHFLILALTLPAVSVLAARLSRIRSRLSAQKNELTEALARIQQMAMRDELTGLLNRRHMQTLLEQESRRSQRSGRGYCLALLDIDHFKRINDSHGHHAGDAALREFATTAESVIRVSDRLARWGGEEFVLMLPETGMAEAAIVLERLREKVAAMRVRTGEQSLAITVSAGLTEHRPGGNLHQSLERADLLLYKAKAGGRNRVVGG